MARGWQVWWCVLAMGGWGGVALSQDDQPDVEEQVADEGERIAAEGEDAEAIEPVEKSFWTGWTTSAELGLNGSTGNTERFNLRAGLNTERLTELMESRGSLSYTLGREEGETTESKFKASARNDWLIPDSRWRYFAKTNLEFDDQQDWEWLWTGSAGVGYEFIDTDRTLLLGRVGLGFSREFGGSDNVWHPEGLLGVDYEYQITERSKVFASAEYLPDLGDFPAYRATAKAGYEVLLDEELNLSLKLGAEMKYDSTPGEGFKRADVDYFAVMVFTF